MREEQEKALSKLKKQQEADRDSSLKERSKLQAEISKLKAESEHQARDHDSMHQLVKELE